MGHEGLDPPAASLVARPGSCSDRGDLSAPLELFGPQYNVHRGVSNFRHGVIWHYYQ